MKKKILSILFSLCVIASFAAPVDENTAKTVALNFLLGKLNNKFGNNANVRLVYTGIEKDAINAPLKCFYIFNLANEKGFVIVAADDEIKPILGYSLESNYDTSYKRGLPVQMVGWLKGYCRNIAFIINHNILATDKIKSQWQQFKQTPTFGSYQLFGSTKQAVAPMLATTWDQCAINTGAPYTYNAFCPYDNKFNARTVTGCVATAMAQVMKYWNYPASGTGCNTYIPATFPYLGTQYANFGATTYNWPAMPNILSASSSTTQINAIATLMYDCGVSVDMQYGVNAVDGSGAYSINYGGSINHTSQDALVNNFGYDNSIQGLQRSNYPDSIWLPLLENELNARRPIIYTGDGSAGGHCFVADGYDTSDMFHFNWGWSGAFNGYFSIDNMNVGGYSFNNDQTALIGIKPRTNTIANAQDSLILVHFYDSTGGKNFWKTNEGWLVAPLSNWYGVILNDSGRVVALNLSDNNLTGNITYDLKGLSQLRYLDLSNNNLSGTIPNIGFNASTLNTIDLSYNKYSGNLPDLLAPNLPNIATLDLSHNKLTGSIPTSLCNQPNLYTLDLSSNQLSGSLPSFKIDTLLSYLYLSNNQFKGAISNSFIAGIPLLNYLDLSNNQFSGSIPSSITGITYLESLDLSNNQLSGTIPDSIGNLSYLSTLQLDSNKLTGSIPSGMSSLSYLTFMDLSHNQLSGAIPSSMSSLTGLFVMDISNNAFNFSGMDNISNLTSSNKSIIYSPQALVPLNYKKGTLSVTVGGALGNNTYNWYFDSVLVASTTGDSTYKPTKTGKYYVAATNAIVNGLTLYSDTVRYYPTLPVTWESFTAKGVENEAVLDWKTATELNNNYFTIQHSTDGKNYCGIGKVPAVGNGSNQYTYTDHYPTEGINYYRLESVDNDGAHSFSNVASVKFASTNYQLSIVPNPVKSTATLRFGNNIQAATLSIYDMNGKKVMEQFIGNPSNSIQINTVSLATGNYIVEVRSSKAIYTQKMVVAK